MALLAFFSAMSLLAVTSSTKVERRSTTWATRRADEDAMLQMDPALVGSADDEEDALQVQRLQFDCEDDEAACQMGSGDDEALLQTELQARNEDDAMLQMVSFNGDCDFEESMMAPERMSTGNDEAMLLMNPEFIANGDDEAMLQIMGNPELIEMTAKTIDDEAMFQVASEPLEMDSDDEVMLQIMGNPEFAEATEKLAMFIDDEAMFQFASEPLEMESDDEAMLQIMGSPQIVVANAELVAFGDREDDEAMFQMAAEPLDIDRDGDL